MNKTRSSYVLWALAAVLLFGLYSVDSHSDKASILSLPSFTSSTETVTANAEPDPTIKQLNDAIVKVAEEAKTTVVTVTVTQTVEMPQNPLARFFGQPGNTPDERQRRGQGSGVIVSDEGYIITNNHVVENADKVEVQLYNDKRFKAKVIGTDPRTDIAVLKIDAEDLDVIKLGNSAKARVGELVLAIGSPLEADLAHSVSMGIISAKDRSIGLLQESGGYENFIQTDAAINPGNSGGALVNMDGELIGINSAIASRSGGSDGIGFAVPVDIAKRVMKSIIEHGKVIRGYLGIEMGGEVDDTMARALGLDKAYGVIVGNVTDDSPADEAGLQDGDVIQTLNGNPIRDFGSLRTAIATSSPGDKVKLGVNRDGKNISLTVTLGELPSNLQMEQQPKPDVNMQEQLGFGVQELTPEIAKELNLSPDQDGVVVNQVSRGSEAYRQGLRRGYVIVEVNREPVSSVSEFNAAMNKLMEDGKDIALLRVLVGQSSQLIAFEL